MPNVVFGNARNYGKKPCENLQTIIGHELSRRAKHEGLRAEGHARFKRRLSILDHISHLDLSLTRVEPITNRFIVAL